MDCKELQLNGFRLQFTFYFYRYRIGQRFPGTDRFGFKMGKNIQYTYTPGPKNNQCASNMAMIHSIVLSTFGVNQICTGKGQTDRIGDLRSDAI